MDEFVHFAKTHPDMKYWVTKIGCGIAELQWLKVHALLGLGKTEEALALLEEIHRTPGVYRKKADSLYNVIKAE